MRFDSDAQPEVFVPHCMAVLESVEARDAAGGNIGERHVLYLSDGQSHADRQASAMKIPKDAAFDSTIALLREGYDFITNRCDRLGSDAFETRLMLRPVVCLRGAEAAEMFYQADRFSRKGAMPQTTLRLLQDKGSVQQLQGPAHRHRKAMFASMLLDEERVQRLIQAFREEWQAARRDWATRGEIVLFDEIFLILTRAVVRWAGVPADEQEARRICSELTEMVENAGGFGVPALAALWRRRRTERFVGALVEQVRLSTIKAPQGSALAVLAEHRDHSGSPMTTEAAAVELINILRPVVAVGRYLVFTAMALEQKRAWRDRFASGDETDLERFVEEVRRVYPFFPFVGGRAFTTFTWRDHRFQRGDWVLLDIYGTNRDPARFPEPGRIDPARASSWKEQEWSSIPQGGGDLYQTHRCPGEAVTVALMMETARLLTRSLSYTVPEQNTDLAVNRIPARPPSGFRMTEIMVRK